MSIFLLVMLSCTGTGLAEWVHVTLEHAHHADRHTCDGREPAVAGHGPVGVPQEDPHDGHDRSHCVVCAALHAPMTPAVCLHLSLQVCRTADRVVALQDQRLDASVPAPRGCRGPPAA